ncbi:TPA: phage tail protein, partial [Yersinia enterocolitica]
MQKIGDIPNTRADNNGEFTDGNVAGGVPPTILPAEWFNTIQRELMSILNAAEIESDPHVFNQVLLSIQKLVSEGIPDLKDASLTQKGIVQLSNATASNSQILAATPKAVSDLGNLLLKITNNLSEIKDAGPVAVAQTLVNLGLGDAAKKNVGTASGTVAAGNDVRFNETTIMYPDGSGASPYNYPANTRKEYANPFPGKNIIVVAEVYYNGVWG